MEQDKGASLRDRAVVNGAASVSALRASVPSATCAMCDDTGYKDYAGFAMDPCDHVPPAQPLRHPWADRRLAQAYDLVDAAMLDANQHPESAIGEAFRLALDAVETADCELETKQ